MEPKYACSEKVSSIQDIFYEVGKRNCYGERDRPTFAALNQLLMAIQFSTVTLLRLTRFFPVCVMTGRNWKMLTILYFIVANIQQRNRLERTVDDILCREGCNDTTCIDLKLLEGYNENVSSNGQNDRIAALVEFIRCWHRI